MKIVYYTSAYFPMILEINIKIVLEKKRCFWKEKMYLCTKSVIDFHIWHRQTTLYRNNTSCGSLYFSTPTWYWLYSLSNCLGPQSFSCIFTIWKAHYFWLSAWTPLTGRGEHTTHSRRSWRLYKDGRHDTPSRWMEIPWVSHITPTHIRNPFHSEVNVVDRTSLLLSNTHQIGESPELSNMC